LAKAEFGEAFKGHWRRSYTGGGVWDNRPVGA
jgi:hypothetical protein